ncbi:murein DD-endopeptidase MepM/ murein hydrolase activator NlpD [Anaerotaenia torta]|uniref:M23 family metallopeptidase n=1 Tax=Anaerotaenia torta TaxID=433293 RepID=UPI003D19102A
MGQIWYTNKYGGGKKRTRKDIKVLAVLLMMLPVIIVTGLQLNAISTTLLLRDIERRGIDYDAFRELKIAEDTLELAKARTGKLMQKHSGLGSPKGIDPIEYLTFSMLARSFDLEKEEPVKEALFLKGIGSIGTLKGYQRLYGYYRAIFQDLEYFPVPRIEGDATDIFYSDTWSEPRSYGGNRRHEGTDIMSGDHPRGYYPVISMTEGIVEKIGWLEQGGYRIGVRSPSGGYFYYAHLASYAPDMKEGACVLAGQLLGFMGDSGYGAEGTVGKFDVHLHLGIYVDTAAGELSVNPYHVLKMMESRRPSYGGYLR